MSVNNYNKKNKQQSIIHFYIFSYMLMVITIVIAIAIAIAILQLISDNNTMRIS